MIEDARLMFEIAELTFHSLNGTLDERGLQRFEELLESNLAVEYYQEILWTFVGMKSMEGISSLQEVENNGLDREFWQALQQEEKDAPAVEIPEKMTSQQLIQKVVYPPKEKRELSKFTIFTLINAAAILLFFLFLRYGPLRPGFEVATLSDCIDAQWADVDGAMEKGGRLATGRGELYLKEGLVEVLFDNNAKVVIEGPAEFEILSEDRIRLNHGNIFSSVPPEAIGFSVFTQNAKIFDLGTEFGVEADLRGNTQVHVIKGSTMLVAGDPSEKKSITVNKGVAKKISAISSEISDIPCDYNYFVRDIDSKDALIWKGANLSLASIIAGYDGFQETDSLVGLDPVTGKYVTSTADVYRKTNEAYNLIAESKFIDGVFIPDGESGPVQITSSGYTFNCPNTKGVSTHEIFAYRGFIENQHTTIPPITMNGQEITNQPIVMLHSNVGITFDLQAIRKTIPQLNLVGFKATGVPAQKFNPKPDLVFWIFIDGQMKYKREIVKDDSDRNPIPFDIEFSSNDRFLTLIVTDGLDNEFANDFFYLIKPELCLSDGMGR